MIKNVIVYREDKDMIDFNKTYILQLRRNGKTIGEISKMTGRTVSEVSQVIYEQNNKEKMQEQVNKLERKTLHLKKGHPFIKYGILTRLSSFWIGVHWSSYNRRLCINLVPCVTIWITFKGGKVPNKE